MTVTERVRAFTKEKAAIERLLRRHGAVLVRHQLTLSVA
jgi:hypothetical protein